jgi:hypothetical protein
MNFKCENLTALNRTDQRIEFSFCPANLPSRAASECFSHHVRPPDCPLAVPLFSSFKKSSGPFLHIYETEAMTKPQQNGIFSPRGDDEGRFKAGARPMYANGALIGGHLLAKN